MVLSFSPDNLWPNLALFILQINFHHLKWLNNTKWTLGNISFSTLLFPIFVASSLFLGVCSPRQTQIKRGTNYSNRDWLRSRWARAVGCWLLGVGCRCTRKWLRCIYISTVAELSLVDYVNYFVWSEWVWGLAVHRKANLHLYLNVAWCWSGFLSFVLCFFIKLELGLHSWSKFAPPEVC